MNSQEELSRVKTQIVQSRSELDCLRQELKAHEDSSKLLVEVKDQQVRFDCLQLAQQVRLDVG